jgi:Uma2 family endonuclease
VEPDLMVAALDAPGEDQLRVPPLLVVEVESPSTRDLDRGRKVELYGEGGASWYWRVELDTPALVIYQAQAGRLVTVQRILAGGAETVGPWVAFLDPAQLLA